MKEISTRERIIEAAYNLFSENGYLGTKTREIAKLASVSEVTLFRKFKNKETLFTEVLKSKSIIPDLVDAVKKVEQSNIENTLFSFAKKFYNVLVSKKKFIMITFSEINHYSEKIIEIYQELISQIDNLIIKILSQNMSINKNFDLKTIAMAFRGMIFELFLVNEILLRKKSAKTDIEKILFSYVKIIIKSIQ